MSNAVATIDRPPRSVLIDMASRYGMEPAAFEATVRATCMKPDKNGRVPSREEFAAFLLVAKEYNLNPLTKEIYAYAAKGGGIVPIVSIDGWVNLINSNRALDGIEFFMEHDADRNLVACTCKIYRKDRSRPIEVTEYLAECVRPTEPWQMKHRMLRHKSLIQCARYAFGFSGIYDEDEGQKIAEARDISQPTVPSAPPVPPPAPPAIAVVAPPASKSIDQVVTVDDPDTFLDNLDGILATASTVDDLNEIFATEAEPAINSDALLQPDVDKANGLYDKHRARIGG